MLLTVKTHPAGGGPDGGAKLQEHINRLPEADTWRADLPSGRRRAAFRFDMSIRSNLQLLEELTEAKDRRVHSQDCIRYCARAVVLEEVQIHLCDKHR